MKHEAVELLFLNADGHGLPWKPDDDWTVRSHVQRAILRSKRKQPALNNIKFVHLERTQIVKRAGQTKKRTEKAVTSMPHLALARSETQIQRTLQTALHPRCSTGYGLSPPPEFCTMTNHHPWTILATDFVHLPSYRLDQLFKSDEFRMAAEPLFDSSHVDATLNMFAVFPGCGSEPAFLNALVFCILIVSHQGRATLEALSIKARTIELLNERIVSADGCLSAPMIGTIMMLRCIAYKFNDCESHEIHSRGLKKALKVCREASLTTAAKRALFWSDLLAMVLVRSERDLSIPAPVQQIRWRRKDKRQTLHQLTSGFSYYSAQIPKGLLDCISDVTELQKLLRFEQLAKTPHHARNYRLDSMQACIESRLVNEAQECKEFPFAEALRLAIFLCCYCSWMETWNSYLIPCRLVHQLITVLISTLPPHSYQFARTWSDKVDILLWLLFVASTAVDLDNSRDMNLKTKQIRLVQYVRYAFEDFTSGELNEALSCALRNFIYCDQWLVQRHRSMPWLELEVLIESENLGRRVQ